MVFLACGLEKLPYFGELGAVIHTFFFISIRIIITIIAIIEKVLDKISFSWDSRPMQQLLGRQTTHVFRSILYYGMYAHIKAKRGKYGEHCEVDTFEGTWDGLTTALLRMSILVMAKES